MSALELDLRLQRGALSLDVALQDPCGSSVGIYGRNGSGKTSLLLAIAGLLRAEGRVAVGGRVLQDTARGVWLPPRARRIGFVFQELRLFPHMSVGQNIAFGAESAEEARRWIESLDLAALLERRPRQLSGGEQQRVALARALATRPDLLLLDEPAAALDGERHRELHTTLSTTLRQARIPALLVSHDLTDLQALCQHLIALDGGQVRVQGATTHLRAHPSLVALCGTDHLDNVLHVDDVHRRDDLLVGRCGPLELALPESPSDPTRGVVAIRAADLLLATGPVGAISARNRLSARVEGVRIQNHTAFVDLDAGLPLVAAISATAAEELGLETGVSVTVLAKRTAIRWLS